MSSIRQDTPLNEIQAEIHGRLLNGALARKPGENLEAFSLRILSEVVANAEESAERYRATQAGLQAQWNGFLHHSFLEVKPSTTNDDGDPIRQEYRVKPAQLEQFAREHKTSASELERLSNGEIKGPVAGLVRSPYDTTATQLGHPYQDPKVYDPPAKDDKPKGYELSQQRASAIRHVEYLPK